MIIKSVGCTAPCYISLSNVTLQYNKTFVDLEKGPFSCKRVRLKRLIFLPRIKSKENHKTANPTDIH